MAADTKDGARVADFKPGDTVRVTARVVEGERERLQTFEGVVLRARRGGAGASFTVRRVSHGIGVERTFLSNSPRLEKVEVTRRGRVRRARLYYLRGRTGKAARIKEKARVAPARRVREEPAAEEQAAAEEPDE